MNNACCTPQRTNEKPSTNDPVPHSSQSHRDEWDRPTITLPGGSFLMGTDHPTAFPFDGEGPVREFTLSPFAIDTYPVTNADFAHFIAATNYLTDSERFGWSFVFWLHIDPEHFESLVADTVATAPWWCKVPGATWRTPEGPNSDISTRANHPVVHVSWNDAAAYAAWANRTLPTEAQWEYAARGGLTQKLYPWGDELTPNGQHLCNIWQGDFPHQDLAEDGFAGTCPVDAFPPNLFGLYSITGNTWEWTADWFSTHHVPRNESVPHSSQSHRDEWDQAHHLQDPTGPPTGHARVMKGGSFLCHASYCNRYRVSARTANTVESAASNVGFRCVRA